MQHLRSLADAGLTHVHLLPVFDIATIDEDRSTHQQPAVRPRLVPAGLDRAAGVRRWPWPSTDGFNWGYDPWHYTVPEGSYATDPERRRAHARVPQDGAGAQPTGLRVVMDVVYNHTNASGQAPKSVLDRIVPGYYHRLNAEGGGRATSTCCANTATEHAMMEKLMVDSVVTWAREYKVDGFRFDLMGHHSKANMLAVREALDELTLARDGVDGKKIYLYGEGWNFGEVANDARFVQATQANMAGTGIGTFNDRLRDAVRGGGPFDGDPRHPGVRQRALLPTRTANPINGTPAEQRARLLLLPGPDQGRPDRQPRGLPRSSTAPAHRHGRGGRLQRLARGLQRRPARRRSPTSRRTTTRRSSTRSRRSCRMTTSKAQRAPGAGRRALDRRASARACRSSTPARTCCAPSRWTGTPSTRATGSTGSSGTTRTTTSASACRRRPTTALATRTSEPLLANPSIKPTPDRDRVDGERFRELLEIRRSSPSSGSAPRPRSSAA